MYFPYFVIIFIGKGRDLSFEQTWVLITKCFGWNWPSYSGKDFLIFVNAFSRFCNYLPLEKGGPFISPSPKDALRQVCLKLVWWFWRKRWKCEQFTTTTTTTTTDNGQFVIRKARKYLSHSDKSFHDWTTQLLNRL